MNPVMSAILTQAFAAGVASVAAVVDHRTGKIPNWLTLPVLLAGPIFWYAAHGSMGLAASFGGMLVCGLPPFIAYRAGGMPGGDLKLFAGVGGLVGPAIGIEIEFFAMVAASVFGLFVLARKRRLMSTLLDSLFLVFNHFLPKSRRRPPPAEEEREQIRMGPFVLLGTLIVLARNGRQWLP